MSHSLILSSDHDGRRLDRTLRSIWPALPLSAIMRALRKGEVRLDSVRAREPGTRVRAGQELHVPWEGPEERTVERRWGTVPILWRGRSALVADKPANLLVQPDVKDGDSVITRVWGMVGGREAGFAPAAVHRLDRNTTGALVVALEGGALRVLERLFKERRVAKRYLAIVVGRAPESGEVDAPLLKDAEANSVRVDRNGKSALTRYRRLASSGSGEGLSLVSIELLTGRTHQARVHMAHAGFPILGDRKYGCFEANRRWTDRVRRPLLHAFELGFPERLDGSLDELSGRTFRAPLPVDMRALVAAWGGEGKDGWKRDEWKKDGGKS